MSEYQELATEPNPPSPDADVDEINVLEILIYFGQRKRFILKVTGISILVGIIVSLLIPPKFEGVVKLMPPQRTQSSALSMLSQLGGSVGSLGLAAAGGGLLGNPNDVYIGMAKSRSVEDGLIQQFNLMKWFKSKDMSGARKSLDSETDIVSGKDTLIEITVLDRDPKMAANIANGYVDQLHALTDHLATTEAGQRRLYFEQQVQDADKALIAAEANLQQTQERTGAIAPESQVKATVDAAVNLQQLVAQKEVELQALKAYATPQNIQVQVAQRELDELKSQLARADQSRSSGGDPLNMGLRSMPSTQIEYLNSYREVQSRTLILQSLQSQLEVARLDEAREGAIIQVVETAIPAEHKTSPSRSLIVLGFAVSGGLLACLYLLLRAAMRSNPKFAKSMADMRSAFFRR